LIGRVRGRSAFDRLLRDGRRSSAGALWCRHLRDDSVIPLRVAFSIPRSIGPAVTRNRLRRRLRVLLARQRELTSGTLLVGVRPTAATELTFEALRRDVSALVAGAASAGSAP
jgi:ribonuclease P protein component